MRAYTFTLVALFFLPLFSLQAQFEGSVFGGAARIDISPPFPAPFTTVSAAINDYATGNTGGAISWRINGVVATELKNQRTITIPVGEVGVPIKIEAVLSPVDGSPVRVEHTIAPAYLDLIVEPQTHIPQFYQGRALPSVGSTVNITGLVNGGATPREELIYSWRLNDTTLLGGPARGQNQVSITMPQGDTVIELKVDRVGGGTIASKTIQLMNTSPFLRFYEINNLYGSLGQPLSSLTLLGNSATVRAEPYYLDRQTFNNPDMAEWTLNGDTAPMSGNPYEITLVRQFTGSALPVGFHVRNLVQVLQGAESGFSVQ